MTKRLQTKEFRNNNTIVFWGFFILVIVVCSELASYVSEVCKHRPKGSIVYCANCNL